MKRNLLLGAFIAGAVAVSGLAAAGSEVQAAPTGAVPAFFLPPGIPGSDAALVLGICDSDFFLGLFPSLAAICKKIQQERNLGEFDANLNGFDANPPVNSPATGTLELKVVGSILNGTSATFKLDWSRLRGNVVSARIRFAQPNSILGGTLVTLCGGGDGAVRDTCGQGGTSGMITTANLPGIVNQLVNPGDFRAFLNVLMNHRAVVEVTTNIGNNTVITELAGLIVPEGLEDATMSLTPVQ